MTFNTLGEAEEGDAMTSYGTSARARAVLFLFVAGTYLSGCSEDSTSPGEGEPPPEPAIEAEASIDAGGGMVEGENLTVEIPAGAWSGTADVRILRDEQLNPFDDTDPDPVMCIEGIPGGFTEAITVRYRRNRGYGSAPRLAVGEPSFSPTVGEVSWAYRIASIDVPDTVRWIEYELVPDERKGASSRPGKDRTMTFRVTEPVNTDYRTSSAGHFEVWYPSRYITAAQADSLAKYLEDAYTGIQRMGFSYAARTSWPVSVSIRHLGATLWGAQHNSVLGDNHGYLEFNREKFSNLREIRIAAAHEFFHIVQSFYDPRGAWDQASGGGDSLFRVTQAGTGNATRARFSEPVCKLTHRESLRLAKSRRPGIR